MQPFSDMRFLLNASNLHVGGGVQVATSVIGELTCMPAVPSGLVVWASDEVDANLRKLGYALSALPTYEVVNTHGLKLLHSPLARRLQNFDAVFTVFGPLYVWRLSGVNVTGFAQPWIIYPHNEIDTAMGWSQRLLSRFKFSLQAFFFRRANQLVVELEHVKAGLLRRRIGSASTITVVHNSLSSLYVCPSSWQTLAVADTGADIRLGFVGRNYLHKNTRIFPTIIDLLRRDRGIKASIYVTFTEDEWSACDDNFRATVTNVGPLFAAQCPTFYRSMDAVIFPSLLECFSATPLEAMAMERPLFASDRPFNRDICQEHAHYFDPLSPESAAQAIAHVFRSGSPNQDALHAAREHAINFSSPRKRAEQYLALLRQAANKANN
jgi:glycosyltransferase involved in cell wall biosynthesis